VPLWFQKSIASHDKVCESLDTLNDTIRCIHDQSHSAREGVHGALRAVNTHLGDKKNQERLGVNSDVVFQLKAAERAACDPDRDSDREHEERVAGRRARKVAREEEAGESERQE